MHAAKDFLETAAYDNQHESGFDIAYETMQVIYAACLSAYEGRRVDINID